VPVWFLPHAAVMAEIGDGSITIGELAAIPGRLTGVASKFTETLHPHPAPGPNGGGHPHPGIVLVAHGTLDADGRTFQLQIRADDRGVRVVRIAFR
jgi:hypothetical protein